MSFYEASVECVGKNSASRKAWLDIRAGQHYHGNQAIGIAKAESGADAELNFIVGCLHAGIGKAVLCGGNNGSEVALNLEPQLTKAGNAAVLCPRHPLDLILYKDGNVTQIEIKKSAAPKDAIKNFSVLKPLEAPDTETSFPDLSRVKATVGTGAVVCMASDILPINKKNWYIPAWLI